MDPRLYEMSQRIEAQVKKLAIVEEVLMNLEAGFDSFEGNLYLETTGSVKEREAKVAINPDLINLKLAIKDAKIAVNRERRMHELLLKAGDWTYGSMKKDAEMIVRQR